MFSVLFNLLTFCLLKRFGDRDVGQNCFRYLQLKFLHQYYSDSAPNNLVDLTVVCPIFSAKTGGKQGRLHTVGINEI